MIQLNSVLLTKKRRIYVKCQKPWHIFFWMLLLRNPSSVSCPIHSELRFIKLEWNTFSPYPGLPRTMTRVRYSVCFLFFFFSSTRCFIIYVYLYFFIRVYSEKKRAPRIEEDQSARSWNVGWRLIYTARGKSTKRNGSWLPRHDIL